MGRKIYLLGVVAVIILFWIVCYSKVDCSTIELRERYLDQLANLGNVHISSEIMIDDYIISGYTGTNGSYGIAIFEPVRRGNYKCQSSINSSGNEILFATVIINDASYDLFWANKSNLDFAKIIYYTDSGPEAYRLDAENNKILYLQAPAKNYDVSATFVTNDGYCYW